MEVFQIIGLLIAGAAGLINYIQNRRRRELAEELPEEGDGEFFPFPEDVLMETDEALESIEQETIRRETVASEPLENRDASPFEEMSSQRRTRGGQWAQIQERVDARNQEYFENLTDESAEPLQDSRRELHETSRVSEPSILSVPIMSHRPKKSTSSRLTTKKRARQAIIDAEVFAPPISKRKKGPFTPLSRPV